MDLNYERDVQVDPDALDVEWLRQAEIGRRYAKHTALLKKAMRKAEQKVKVIRAELIRECNDNPAKCTGKEKPNLIDQESFYRTHPKHLAAKEEWIDACYEAEYAEMVQKEISYTRKATLEGLVALYTAQYFAGPTTPRNINREWLEAQQREKSNDAVDRAMKRKK